MTSSTQNLTAIASELKAAGKSVKVTVLRPSRRGETAARRMWRAAAPKGAFQHGSVPGAGSVRSGNGSTKVM